MPPATDVSWPAREREASRSHALRGVEGALQQIASERRLGGEWVDAFFPSVERGKKRMKGTPAAPEGDVPA